MNELEIDSEREFCNCGNLMQCKNTFTHRNEDDEISDYVYDEIFKIFICPACNNATLLCYSTGINIYRDELDDNNVETTLLLKKYDRKILYAPKRRFHSAIPQPIAEIAHQAESVLFNSPRACFILCRAILEEICNDFEIPVEGVNNKGKSYLINLHNRLIQLFDQENMPEDLALIIQGIKELGNEGAHSKHLTFAKQVKSQEANSLLTLVKYVIERLYVDKYRQQEAEEVLNNLKGKILHQKDITSE